MVSKRPANLPAATEHHGDTMGFTIAAPTRGCLAQQVGQTLRVRAVYARTGTRKVGHRSYPTVLLVDVRDVETGALLTDHLWFNRGGLWQRVSPVQGDVVTFEARVIEYRTGYWGPNRVRQILEPARSDYRLTPPTSLSLSRLQSNGGEAA